MFGRRGGKGLPPGIPCLSPSSELSPSRHQPFVMQSVQNHQYSHYNSYSLLAYNYGSFSSAAPHDYPAAAATPGYGYSYNRQQPSQTQFPGPSTYQRTDGFSGLQAQTPSAMYQNPLLCQPLCGSHPNSSSSYSYTTNAQQSSPAQQPSHAGYDGYNYGYDAPAASVAPACQPTPSLQYLPDEKVYSKDYASPSMYDDRLVDRYGSVQPEFFLTPCAMLAVTNPETAVPNGWPSAPGASVIVGAPAPSGSFPSSSVAGNGNRLNGQHQHSTDAAPHPLATLKAEPESSPTPKAGARPRRKSPRDALNHRPEPRISQQKAIQRAAVAEMGFEPIDCNSISSHDKKRYYLVCLENYVSFLDDQMSRVGSPPLTLERVDKYPKGLSSRSMRNMNKKMYETLRDKEAMYTVDARICTQAEVSIKLQGSALGLAPVVEFMESESSEPVTHKEFQGDDVGWTRFREACVEVKILHLGHLSNVSRGKAVRPLLGIGKLECGNWDFSMIGEPTGWFERRVYTPGTAGVALASEFASTSIDAA
ncbi:hypothetical protein CONPUDRAFT_140725 [Coniophora puteana RWD-64-598 SS2]|uniref:Uncharacterized protein n=1 Tax=Coniophora puteana (strain RWD-64-598) TaxID=741705 RepID=A0A5M3N3F0_CONPW|nr:uncharacterized protein CONPUDRAFT_140725 [Coniophora puteana RWD-64-598 SS2]EIW85920.1 hypothetical protein CONPUDRAFT_140725 [Coniophora puteana RWD-64-598 SS2]